MQRELYQTRVEADASDGRERVVIDLRLAASGLDEAVAHIHQWCRDNGLQVARHGPMERVRKARRQEATGIVDTSWMDRS